MAHQVANLGLAALVANTQALGVATEVVRSDAVTKSDREYQLHLADGLVGGTAVLGRGQGQLEPEQLLMTTRKPKEQKLTIGNNVLKLLVETADRLNQAQAQMEFRKALKRQFPSMARHGGKVLEEEVLYDITHGRVPKEIQALMDAEEMMHASNQAAVAGGARRGLHKLPTRYRELEEQVKQLMSSKHVTDRWGYFGALQHYMPQQQQQQPPQTAGRGVKFMENEEQLQEPEPPPQPVSTADMLRSIIGPGAGGEEVGQGDRRGRRPEELADGETWMSIMQRRRKERLYRQLMVKFRAMMAENTRHYAARVIQRTWRTYHKARLLASHERLALLQEELQRHKQAQFAMQNVAHDMLKFAGQSRPLMSRKTMSRKIGFGSTTESGRISHDGSRPSSRAVSRGLSSRGGGSFDKPQEGAWNGQLRISRSKVQSFHNRSPRPGSRQVTSSQSRRGSPGDPRMGTPSRSNTQGRQSRFSLSDGFFSNNPILSSDSDDSELSDSEDEDSSGEGEEEGDEEEEGAEGVLRPETSVEKAARVAQSEEMAQQAAQAYEQLMDMVHKMAEDKKAAAEAAAEAEAAAIAARIEAARAAAEAEERATQEAEEAAKVAEEAAAEAAAVAAAAAANAEARVSTPLSASQAGAASSVCDGSGRLTPETSKPQKRSNEDAWKGLTGVALEHVPVDVLELAALGAEAAGDEENAKAFRDAWAAKKYGSARPDMTSVPGAVAVDSNQKDGSKGSKSGVQDGDAETSGKGRRKKKKGKKGRRGKGGMDGGAADAGGGEGVTKTAADSQAAVGKSGKQGILSDQELRQKLLYNNARAKKMLAKAMEAISKARLRRLKKAWSVKKDRSRTAQRPQYVEGMPLYSERRMQARAEAMAKQAAAKAEEQARLGQEQSTNEPAGDTAADGSLRSPRLGGVPDGVDSGMGGGWGDGDDGLAGYPAATPPATPIGQRPQSLLSPNEQLQSLLATSPHHRPAHMTTGGLGLGIGGTAITRGGGQGAEAGTGAGAGDGDGEAQVQNAEAQSVVRPSGVNAFMGRSLGAGSAAAAAGLQHAKSGPHATGDLAFAMPGVMGVPISQERSAGELSRASHGDLSAIGRAQGYNRPAPGQGGNYFARVFSRRRAQKQASSNHLTGQLSDSMGGSQGAGPSDLQGEFSSQSFYPMPPGTLTDNLTTQHLTGTAFTQAGTGPAALLNAAAAARFSNQAQLSGSSAALWPTPASRVVQFAHAESSSKGTSSHLADASQYLDENSQASMSAAEYTNLAEEVNTVVSAITSLISQGRGEGRKRQGRLAAGRLAGPDGPEGNKVLPFTLDLVKGLVRMAAGLSEAAGEGGSEDGAGAGPSQPRRGMLGSVLRAQGGDTTNNKRSPRTSKGDEGNGEDNQKDTTAAELSDAARQLLHIAWHLAHDSGLQSAMTHRAGAQLTCRVRYTGALKGIAVPNMTVEGYRQRLMQQGYAPLAVSASTQAVSNPQNMTDTDALSAHSQGALRLGPTMPHHILQQTEDGVVSMIRAQQRYGRRLYGGRARPILPPSENGLQAGMLVQRGRQLTVVKSIKYQAAARRRRLMKEHANALLEPVVQLLFKARKDFSRFTQDDPTSSQSNAHLPPVQPLGPLAPMITSIQPVARTSEPGNINIIPLRNRSPRTSLSTAGAPFSMHHSRRSGGGGLTTSSLQTPTQPLSAQYLQLAERYPVLMTLPAPDVRGSTNQDRSALSWVPGAGMQRTSYQGNAQVRRRTSFAQVVQPSSRPITPLAAISPDHNIGHAYSHSPTSMGHTGSHSPSSTSKGRQSPTQYIPQQRVSGPGASFLAMADCAASFPGASSSSLALAHGDSQHYAGHSSPAGNGNVSHISSSWPVTHTGSQQGLTYSNPAAVSGHQDAASKPAVVSPPLQQKRQLNDLMLAMEAGTMLTSPGSPSRATGRASQQVQAGGHLAPLMPCRPTSPGNSLLMISSYSPSKRHAQHVPVVRAAPPSSQHHPSPTPPHLPQHPHNYPHSQPSQNLPAGCEPNMQSAAGQSVYEAVPVPAAEPQIPSSHHFPTWQSPSARFPPLTSSALPNRALGASTRYHNKMALYQERSGAGMVPALPLLSTPGANHHMPESVTRRFGPPSHALDPPSRPLVLPTAPDVHQQQGDLSGVLTVSAGGGSTGKLQFGTVAGKPAPQQDSSAAMHAHHSTDVSGWVVGTAE